MLMGDQMRRAFEDLLRAECAAGPVLLVLEDLHWGDLPTVKFVDAAAHARRSAADGAGPGAPRGPRPLPSPVGGPRAPRGQARRASRRAGERLVRAVLGEDHDAAATAALVQRSAGNAFYLEELIRKAAEGRGDAVPETVLAMAQSRIEEQDAEARRILRAASVFGQTFWRSGVAALLGSADPDAWLRALADRELISGPREGRFPARPSTASSTRWCARPRTGC